MIDYTARLADLMKDIVARVPELSCVKLSDVLVFARAGRSNAEGALATCHCLSLPTSEPGYYFWRYRTSGRITRRSEWFVTKSPVVTVGSRTMKYMISFALPRFCDQSLDHSRKERFYRRASDSWIAKLDTVVHELYHIDPEQNGIRRLSREDGTYLANCHSPRFFTEVADMVTAYLDSNPDREIYDFLRYDFATLETRYGGVTATSFRTFPSFPQRFIESHPDQPACDASLSDVEVEPLRPNHLQKTYTEEDLYLRQFMKETSRRLAQVKAA